MKKLSYQKPNFKKYGSMKHLVFGSGGSGGDGMGSTENDGLQADGDRNLPDEMNEGSDAGGGDVPSFDGDS